MKEIRESPKMVGSEEREAENEERSQLIELQRKR
jgi:hypothetical protein